MKVVYLLGAVLFISVYSACAAPTDDGELPVPETVPQPVEAPVDTPVAVPVAGPVAVPVAAPVAPPDSTPAVIVPQGGYRKETLDTVSKQTSDAHSKTKTKEKVKVITKHLKNGGTVTIIKDKTKTKTKSDLTTDDFNQSNHTLTEGGVEESDSLTTDKQHHLKETDIKKKTDIERIVTDKYGNVVSDTHKIKEKEKVKKKEQDTEQTSLIHTVKRVPPPVIAVDPTETPPPVPAPANPPACGC